MTSPEEKLSRLLDDELQPDDASRLLAEMHDDPALQAAWRRYHVVRQNLRGEPLAVANPGFASEVARLLAAEAVDFHSVQNRSEQDAGLRYRDWLRPLVGLALAASIAAVAVLGMRESGFGQLPADMTNAWLTHNGSKTMELQQADNGLVSAEQLNEYLVMHNEGVYLSGADGMLPQARVVSIVNP